MDSFTQSKFRVSNADHHKTLESLLASMDQTNPAVRWRSIPINRINTNTTNTGLQKLSISEDVKTGKRVTWSENLLDIRNISPRHSKDQFRFPQTNSRSTTEHQNHQGQQADNCNHFICGAGQPCRLKAQASSPYSPSSKSSSSPSPLS